MEPVIRYARTSDGVSVAYAVMGEGTPLVACTATWGGELHHYVARSALASVPPVDALIASDFRVLIYDNRGMGSSDRTSTDYTIETRLRDLDAVIAHAGLDRFVLVSYFAGGPPALVYSIQHPERVTHLALANTYAVGAEYWESTPVGRVAHGMRSMAEDEWDYYTRLIANAALEFTDSEGAHKLAEAIRAGISSGAFIAQMEAAQTLDVSDMLPSVNVPTLVLHDTTLRAAGYRLVAQELARGIPNARFVATNDAAHAIRQFVDEGAATSAYPEPGTLPSGTAVILFAEMERTL